MDNNVNSLVFKVVSGMTPDDVKNSKSASEEQKAVAFLFDTDENASYSQEEADSFNNAVIQKNGKKYSIWTKNEQGEERQIKYKENKYIKVNDYEGNWVTSAIKRVWDNNKECWRTKYNCTSKNGYIQNLYYTNRNGRKEVTENFRDTMILTNDNKTKYDKDGNVIENRYREYNWKGKITKEIVTKGN